MIGHFIEKIMKTSKLRQTSDISYSIAPAVQISPEKDNSEYHKIICESFVSGISSLNLIRSSIVATHGQLSQEKEKIVELNVQNSSTMQSLESLVLEIREASEKSREVNEKMAQLKESLKKINNFISEIQKIANQTNLIAINSAIEAARVGESGRGFSVISKEVRLLAENIKDSTRLIFLQTENLQQDGCTVEKSIETQLTIITEIIHHVDNVVNTIKSIISKSSAMKSIIDYITSLMFLNIIKMDHVIWKIELYNKLTEQNNEGEVTSHTECRLGKWYYSSDSEHFSKLMSFGNLESPHQMLHSSGKLALEYSRSGDNDLMSGALKSMEQASEEVMKQLEVLGVDIFRQFVINTP